MTHKTWNGIIAAGWIVILLVAVYTNRNAPSDSHEHATAYGIVNIIDYDKP